MSLFEEYSQKNNHPPHNDILKKLHIRRAKVDDAERIAELTAQREGLPLSDILPKIKDEISNLKNSHRAILLIAEIDRQVVGFARAIYFQPGNDAPANSCPKGWYLTGVIIDPEYSSIRTG